MNKAVIYIHGKGGNAQEAEHYVPLFPDSDVIGFDYRSETPWEAKREFTAYFSSLSKKYESISVIANSIGAFFVMNAQVGTAVEESFFISPVVDMEKLILGMMDVSGISEERLRNEKIITSPFGETLSWEYLCYVRKDIPEWSVPTHILYGEKDDLTDFDTVSEFVEKAGFTLDVMSGAEHWFHTPEQMRFLDNWIKTYTKTVSR